MVDEIFTGKFKLYELSDTGYTLLRSESDQIESDIVKQKLDKQPDTTNMPDLESEESAAQTRNQQGKGLKILIPNQMLNRLPTSLPQLKAGNNSEELKNEIRQLLYSFYKSKKLTKHLYKSSIDII